MPPKRSNQYRHSLLIQCDKSQLEWRVAVEYAQDPVGIEELLEAHKTGFDIHEKNKVELELPSRLISKIFLFRTIFRGNGWSFANDPKFQHVSKSPQYWDEKNAKFYEKYKGLDNLHKYWAQRVIHKKMLIGIQGREWFVPMKERNGEPEIPWTDLSNWPVQGTGNDIVAIERVSLFKRLKKYKMDDVKMVLTVHDSNAVDAPDHRLKDVASIMYEVADDLPKNFKKLFNYEMSIPFPSEVKYGKSLAEQIKLTRNEL